MIVRCCKPQDHLLASKTSKILQHRTPRNSSILMFECISHNLRADVSTVSSRRVWADPCGLGSKVHRRFQQDYDMSYVVYVLYFLYPEMAPEGSKSCCLMYHAIMCQQKNRLPSSNSDLPPKLPNHPVRHCAAWQ